MIIFVLCLYIIREKLQNADTQVWLADQICKNLPEPWNERVKVGLIGGKLPGQFVISSLIVSVPNGDTLEMKDLEFGWDWFELLSGKLVVEKLQIDAVKVLLNQSKEGKWLQNFNSSELKENEPSEEAQGKFELPDIKFSLKEISFKSLQLELKSQKESWDSLKYELKELRIKALGDISPDRINLDSQFYSAMKFSLDQNPSIDLNFKIELKSNKEEWSFKIKEGIAMSSKSKIPFNVELYSSIDLVSMLKEPMKNINKLWLKVKSENLNLVKGEINLYSNGIIFKDDLSGGFGFEIKEGKPELNLNLKTGENKVWFKAFASRAWAIDKDNQLEINGGSVVIPNDWKKELDGRLELKFNAKSNNIFDTNLLLADLQLKVINPKLNKKELIPLNAKIELESGVVKVNISSQSNVIECSINAQAYGLGKIPSGYKPSDIQLSFDAVLAVKDLEKARSRYAYIIKMPVLKGSHSIDIKGSGNSQRFDLSFLTKASDLVIDKPMPKALELELGLQFNFDQILKSSHNISAYTEKELPEFLKSLAKDWPEIITMGKLTYLKGKSLGSGLLNNIDEIRFSVLESTEKNDYKINFETKNNENNIDCLYLSSNIDKDSIQLSFNKIDFAISNYFSDLKSLFSDKISLIATSHWRWDWNKLELDIGDFELNNQLLAIVGQLGFSKPLGLDISLAYPDLKQLPSQWTKDLPVSFNGILTNKINLSGDWKNPNFSFLLDAHKLKVLSSELPTITFDEISLNTKVDFSTDKQVEVYTRIIPTGEVGLGAQLICPVKLNIERSEFSMGNNISYKIQTLNEKGMNIHWVQPLVNKVIKNIQGNWLINLTGEVDLNNPIKPNLRGELQVRGVTAELLNPPLEIHKFEFDMKFEPTFMKIENLNLVNNDNSIKMHGIVETEKYDEWDNPSWNMFINIHDWQLMLPPELEAKLNAHLISSGNLHSHNTQGNVIISNMILKPVLDLSNIESIKGRDPNLTMVDSLQSWDELDKDNKVADEKEPTYLENTSVDLNLKLLNNNRVIYKEMFKSEIEGELVVKKKYKQKGFHPQGEIRLLRSQLKFQGKTFKMEKGLAFWRGALVPDIDMIFSTKIKPYEIDIALQGSVEKLQPRLSSNPWLENSDIMSVLMFGKPIHSGTSEKSDTKAMDIAVSQGTQMLSQKMGLDRFGVNIDSMNSRGGKISIGRYLHPKLYFSASKIVGDEEGREVSFEYLIMKYLKLKLVKELKTPIGIDFEWGKDY